MPITTDPGPADTEKPIDRARAERLMRLATYAAVAVAGSLVAVKFAAWVLTDSVSILSTLIDSMLDVAASVVNLLAVRHALQPADEQYRFGYGKAESLAGLAQAGFISGSAIFLLIESGERLYSPTAISNTPVGYAVMGVAIVATLALVTFQKYVARRTRSVAISADSAHYTMDILVNVSVIVSLFLASGPGWTLADPLFAIAIAVYILRGAYEVGRDAFMVLMDRELPEDDREKIRQLALAHPKVLGIHDLRTRQSGPDVFIQLHLELPGDLTLNAAHAVADVVIDSVEAAFPRAEVLVHEDPTGVKESRAFED
ncbi:MAG: cation diffusion facilitator family transporter [Alphaproteobacteria bacterium]|nr:cation diffusion facilitator family transporter [Alphaproteobacteria bacterium]MBF0251864.1 cation diffusion facilitator family transporter [Alphaproteobacteria bacterium]